jgi:hypothetical protein
MASGLRAEAAAADEPPRQSPPTILKAIVILIAFPDVPRKIESALPEQRFFRDLDGYIREMSYGKVGLAGDVTKKWYTLPQSVAAYRISPRNLEVDRSRVQRLLRDSLALAEADVDFSRYDFAVIYMAADVQDYGMVGLCAYPGMLGWQSDAVLRTPRGQTVKRGVAIFTQRAHLGTLFHDTAHVLGGVKDGKRMVPCLYDHDLQAKPSAPDLKSLHDTFVEATIHMGFWDPMSCHFYQMQLPPPGISSWTKLRLGWLEPSKVRVVEKGETARLILAPLEYAPGQTLAIKVPLTATTYYLIENRQPVGFDRNLPGSGVLIMYADDAIPECRGGRGPVHLMDANPGVAHLEGAAFNIGKNGSFMDKQNGVGVELLRPIGRGYVVQVQRNAAGGAQR